ncbi:MAG: hypothetical protein MUC36_05675 [Planctomycetes bacterium]|nr:hypothetical protein [Planctomycetota bacterium]
MSATKWQPVGVLATLAAVAAVLLWWLWRADDAPPVVVGDRTRSTTPPAGGSASAPDDATGPSGTAASNSSATSSGNLARERVLAGQQQPRGRLMQGPEPLADHMVELWTGEYGKFRPAGIEVVTDRLGRFVLPPAALPSVVLERTWIRVRGPRAPELWFHGYWQPAIGDVAVPAPTTLRGRVVDEQAVALAAVNVWLASPFEALFEFDLPADSVRRPRAAVTDVDGRFVFERAHHDSLRVLAKQPGLLAASASLDLPPGGTGECELVLRRGQVCSGVVHDHAGRPVAGAEVLSYGRCAEVVKTDVDGRFVYPTLGPSAALQVRAGDAGGIDGVKVDGSGPVRIDLPRTAVLRVRVEGTGGAATTVQLQHAIARPGEPSRQMMPMWMRERCRAPLPTGADGVLELRGVALADYALQAVTEGVGRSEWQYAEVRSDHEVVLKLVPERRCRIQVRSETGAPIAGASVRWPTNAERYAEMFAKDGPRGVLAWVNGGSYGNHRALTGPDGTVEVSWHPPHVLAFWIEADGFLSQGRVFGPGAGPESCEIGLQQLDVVHGTVAVWRPGTNRPAVVAWRPADEDAVQRGTAGWLRMPVGDEGEFTLRLLPGTWRIGISYENELSIGVPEGHDGVRLPLLGGGVDVRTATTIEVATGAVTEVQLAAQALGELTGRVLLGEQPVAGVRVVARPLRAADPLRADQDPVEDYATGVVTGADGRFQFLVLGARECELLVEHPRAATRVAQRVGLPDPGARIEHDVVLPGASVRGRFRLDALGADDRALARAILCPAAKAGEDPYQDSYSSSDDSLPLFEVLPSCELAATDGAFGFEFVRPGTYLLRIHLVERRRGRLLVDREIVVGAGDVVLPDLEVAPRHDARVELTAELAELLPSVVVVHRSSADGSSSMWVATAVCEVDWRQRRARVTLPALPPGRYTVAPREDGFVREGMVSAAPFAIEVRADGVCEPAAVVLKPQAPR